MRAEQAAEVGIEKTGNAFKALKDIEEIQQLLPHRQVADWGNDMPNISIVMLQPLGVLCCPQVPIPPAGQSRGV